MRCATSTVDHEIVHTATSPALSSTDSPLAKEPPTNWQTTNESNNPLKTQRASRSPWVAILGFSCRIILLDLPILLTFLLYGATRWFGHVQYEYLFPQYDALKFDRQRNLLDNTYYTRVCNASDMSTYSGNDLFLDENATPQQAYHHHLKHGFTVFRNILQPTTANNLRDYIVKRNQQLTKEESIYVISGTHRYSFGLGTEVPEVAEGMAELAQNPRLKAALTEILGPDPALIEMTAITSTYGAAAQWWHDDVVSMGSPVQYARAFGPSYSIFVALQNTTREMGATAACPGTHFCSGGRMDQFCDQHGFQLVSDSGYWNQGDALLMNMNSWHRGGAHTDPHGLDRVMLILTFVPKPETRAETRQMAQGITFSLRWDMWGHTLSDLASAKTAMAQPWTTLRALGLYKKPGASWGIDYITSASIRASNADNGFKDEDLEAFLEGGGFSFLPRWLQEFSIDWDYEDPWPLYFEGTQMKCEKFFGVASLVGAILYMLFFVTKKQLSKGTSLRSAFLRLGLMAAVTWGLYRLAISHVDSTPWAHDIRRKLRYVSTADIDQAYFLKSTLPWGQSTLPTKRDVLIENRFGSRQLEMYNDFVPLGHPGNIEFNAVVKRVSVNYNNYSPNIQKALIQFVADSVTTDTLRRFLLQGPDGFWMWILHTPTFFIHAELSMTRPFVRAIMESLRHVESEYKYGMHRKTALAIKHAVPYAQTLRLKFVPELETKQEAPKVKQAKLLRRSPLPSLRLSPSPLLRSPDFFSIPIPYHEPYPNAWLQAGDPIEVHGENYWYFGTIFFVTAQGQFVIQNEDKQETVDRYSVRRVQEYSVGEVLECYESGQYYRCKILGVLDDDSYIVQLDDQLDDRLDDQLDD